MEKAVFNIKELKITQGMNGDYSHKGELAIDIGACCEYFKAPFTGTIKRIYTNSNTVWLESNEKVKYADGTEDYMVVMTCHDNDVSNLWVGKVIKQGETYYQPGTKGNVTGSHIHLGVGKGKFTGNGWHKGEYQKAGFYAWPINNQYNIVDALFLYDKVEIVNAMYNWKKTDTFVVENITPNVERNEEVEQVEVLIDNLRVREEPSLNGAILGYAIPGFYNVYDKKENDGYLWVKIAEGQWIATNDEEGWTKIYPATDYKKLYEEELEKNELLQKEVQILEEKIAKAIEDLK